MSYQVLARKYRPQKFSEVIGQEHVTRTLQNAIAQERIAHGYIFSGHRGIGKTTVARILAMALNCRSTNETTGKPPIEPCGVCDSCVEIRAGNSVDVIEIDAATNRGIDEIRELREAARYRPARDRFKIYILDEAHQITDAAFNALLKTLEEPPSHVIFMMATTQPEDIPQTIRSRCQHFSYRAMKFDAIIGQLRDIVTKENIPADENALALLAEAGDGSMRDALSILDQAIASTSDHLTADSVRSLIGSAPAAALETVMQAVAESSSERILVLVDELIGEGHSPTHFARQLVRFLRNVTVAKIAGKDSALLQISSDERARVARIAELFSEEDLARHLQIMLRTHGELGYRHEQRFHLELGLLKMAHAQRLLPIEQLLSDAAGSTSGPIRTTPRPVLATAADSRRMEIPAAARSSSVSPFAADSARKGNPKTEASGEGFAGGGPFDSRSGQVRATQTSANVVIMGSAAPAVAELSPEPESQPAEANAEVNSEVNAESLRDAVLNALGNQQMLVSILESAEWTLNGSSLTAKVSASGTMIEMSYTADARRMAGAAASARAGRPIRVLVEPGGTQQAVPAPRRADNGSARSRAEQDPIVQRMQEKFGAEIRTVIDYREKG
ncbi:MAG TPA: DNA polymerase III subunit gamma/tau [Terriglobales bacterium]|jgi:DNA polymerase-3 subunit gamma/tau|nr:DNA polymerase III subunit gamma/tau [Terriglobales bacterium]